MNNREEIIRLNYINNMKTSNGMKKLFFAGFLVVSMPFIAGAQAGVPTTTNVATTVTLKDAGLAPGDFFYFLDRFGEGVNNFFTFKTESKARLALEHAQERASEVNAVLKTKGVKSKEVKRAKDDFDKGLSLAASVIADGKVKGNEVSELAKEIDDEFEESKDMLKEAYRDYREELNDKEKDLRKKLSEAIKAGDVKAIATIEVELKKINEDASITKDEEDLVDDSFEEEKNKFENSMGKQHSAESHITNAERARVKFVNDMAVLGTATTQDIVKVLASFDTMLASAKTAFAIGEFEIAKDNAKEARNILREFLGDLKDDMDIKELEKDFFDDKKSEMRVKNTEPLSERNQVMWCTKDAKLCPDGSTVGRTGPKCEFTECPSFDARVNVGTER